MVGNGFYGHARRSCRCVASYTFDPGITKTLPVNMSLVTAGYHVIARGSIRLVATGAGKRPAPGRCIVRFCRGCGRLCAWTVAVGTAAGTVTGRTLAGQIVGIVDIAGVAAKAAVGRSSKRDDQVAVAGAGGMGKGITFRGMVRVAFSARRNRGGVIITMLLAGTTESRMTAVGRSGAVAFGAGCRVGAQGRVGRAGGHAPNVSGCFKMTINAGAGTENRCVGLWPGGLLAATDHVFTFGW